MRRALWVVVVVALMVKSASAQINDWRTGDPIPGTDAITVGPGMVLPQWNTPTKNLRYADFAAGRVNVSGSDFTASWLDSARFWNANASNCKFDGASLISADFTNANLNGASLTSARMTNAIFDFASLSNANFTDGAILGAKFTSVTSKGFTQAQLESTASYRAKDLTGVSMENNDLSGWSFLEQNLTDVSFLNSTLKGTNFNYATLTDTDFGDANVEGARFWDVTSRDFTEAQLASTASYKAKNLTGIELAFDDMFAWDFGGQNLTNASFFKSNVSWANFAGATLVNANFTEANVNYAQFTGADFGGATLKGAKLWGVTDNGFTQAQFVTTGSYQTKDLTGIELPFNTLDGWNFQGQNLTNALLGVSTLSGANFAGANLTNASLHGTTLADANFTGAIFKDASLENTTAGGFTRAQLESTASFQAKDLQGVRLWNNNMTGWNFSGQNLTKAELGNSSLANANFAAANLTNASLNSSNLTNADLTGANISGADLRGVTPRGFTRTQFESTENFLAKNLQGIGLTYNDLSGWNLAGQDLTGANLGFATLTGTNLSNAKVQGASFESTTSRGFTFDQLASTASFKAKDLRGISLLKDDLSGWDLRGQNFLNAHFGSAKLVQTNLSFADMRGVLGLDLTGAIDRNMIGPDGVIDGFGMFPSELMVIRDDDGVSDPPPGRLPRDPISVTVEDHFTMAAGSTLRLVLDSDWLSVIGFEPGIAVRLDGTLDLRFAAGTNVSSQIGRSIRLFDWTGVDPRGEFSIGGPYKWDVRDLYSGGTVRLAQSDPLSTGGGYDIADLNNVRNNFGGSGFGDYNLDGIVDIDDLNLVRNNFNPGANLPVPEPHSMVLLAVSAAGFAAFARRRRSTL